MLAICSTGLLIVGLDATIVNVALPAIHRSLGSSLAGLQWTVDAYTLVLASLLMLAGSTADRRRPQARVPARAGSCSRSDRCCARSRPRLGC